MEKSSRNDRKMLEKYSDKIADEGRGEDDVIGHLTKGEVVIPKAFMENKEVASAINKIFAAYNVNINQYTVGHKDNSINPNTGNPEFKLKRFLGTIVGGTIGFFIGGPAGAVQGAKIGASVDVARAGYSAAETAKKESELARTQAAEQATEANRIMEEQIAAQQQQSAIAAERLQLETSRAAEEKTRFEQEKAKLESEAKKRAEELEASQREMAERESSRLRATRRSGRRSLLSQERLAPELGLGFGGANVNQMMRG
jgi:flagellar biosynthesis GTPase FlhF